MKRFSILVAACTLLLAAPVLAQVPPTMSYQGVLTDASGTIVPNGFYDLTFRIYNVPAAGAPIWAEAHTGASHVAVSRGGFSVLLGSINPLNPWFDGPLYLGIQIGGDPELSPRIPLAAAPYALGLRLPFRLSSTAGSPFLVGHDFGGIGGALDAFDETGGYIWALEADADGSGGYFFVGGGSGAVYIDGNAGGPGSPVLSFVGTGSTSIFDTNTPGNGSVILPTDAISAGEILDEPGVAQGHVNASATVPIGSTMADLVTVSITTPASGYIVVEADGQHGLGGNSTSSYNYAALQIDETAGGSTDANHYFLSGYSGPAGGRNTFTYTPVSLRRTYFKSAGSYTFRLEGYGTQNESLSNYLWNPTITATFYPTSYGAVTTSPALADAGQFSETKRTVSEGNGPGQPAVQGELVDLRELELRVQRAAADVERAKRELIEARMAEQNRARAAATAAPQGKK